MEADTFYNPGMSFVSNVRNAVHQMTVAVEWDRSVPARTQRSEVAEWIKEMDAVAEQVAPDVALTPGLEEKILGHGSEMVQFQHVLGHGKEIHLAQELPFPSASLTAFERHFPDLCAVLKPHRKIAIARPFQHIRDVCVEKYGPKSGIELYKLGIIPVAREVLDKGASWAPADMAVVRVALGRLAEAIGHYRPTLGSTSPQPLNTHSAWMISIHDAIRKANKAADSRRSNTAHSLGQLRHRQQRIYGISQPAFASRLAARGMRSF
ncbi:hypothetical protein JCM10207_001570 [Rhodosporidiobolus poonsookiae]